jgi:hypothetical protein
MSISRFLSPRYLIGGAAAVALFLAFNLSRPPLETETQAQFIAWYEGASAYLNGTGEQNPAPRPIQATITLVSDTTPSGKTTSWSLPVGAPEERELRSRLARVLELVKESGVYASRTYLVATPPRRPHVAITVTEDTKNFTAHVPLTDIEENIQLKNLLKLLEIFTASPAATVAPINPSQL